MTQTIEQVPDAAERLRLRHLADQRRATAEQVERIGWSAERLAEARRDRLRELLRTAVGRSPWHRARLAGIDVDRFEEDQLHQLPVMTKTDLMENFDQIVTDSRLSRGLVERHLAGLGRQPHHLLGEFMTVASGGSTGVRGIFPWGWDAWATCYLGWFRYLLRDYGQQSMSMVLVAAGKAAHISKALLATFSDPDWLTLNPVPITLPIDDIIAGVQQAQPDAILSYPSAIAELARAAQAGKLKIKPRAIATAGEPLLPEVRKAAEETFGIRVMNWWLCSEGGPLAIGCGHGHGLHLSDDLVIVEPVDREGQPVPNGTRSDNVYLTNLYNPTLPLIRYELRDEIKMLDKRCACGSQHRLIDDPVGRMDDSFTYPDGTIVHPHVFRTVLGLDPGVIEYQVQQTVSGAAIKIRGETDFERLRADIAAGLERQGLTKPQLTFTTVHEFVRQETGKLPRFLPIR